MDTLELDLKLRKSPIGIFDSGYGGLTILDKIRKHLPQYDYIYLGDNARAPYGTRSFDVVYKYTLECVKKLFELDCQLVILACNTASAKALRTIQQNDLPAIDASRRVLGVIRPTVELVGDMTKTNHIGLLATPGTVNSNSYPLEIQKLYPEMVIHSEACPLWVPLIENEQFDTVGADFFFKQNMDNLLAKDEEMDTIILGCTHYPIVQHKLEKLAGSKIKVVSQGQIVAERLADYLHRHPEMEQMCSTNSSTTYFTTESIEKFSNSASVFLNENIIAKHIELEA